MICDGLHLYFLCTDYLLICGESPPVATHCVEGRGHIASRVARYAPEGAKYGKMNTPMTIVTFFLRNFQGVQKL